MEGQCLGNSTDCRSGVCLALRDHFDRWLHRDNEPVSRLIVAGACADVYNRSGIFQCGMNNLHDAAVRPTSNSVPNANVFVDLAT